FLTNLGLLLFLNLLIKPFWIFGIDRTVQNTVGVEEYGFYFVVFNFSFLFNILLDFGITNFNNRNIAQHNHLLNKHVSGILVLKLLLVVVYFLFTFLAALLWGFSMDQLKLLVLLGFNQFLISFILYLRSNISGLLFFKTDSILSVLDRFLMILFCGVLLWGHVTKEAFRIEWFVYCQTVAYLITVLIALYIVIRKANFRKLNWNWLFFLMIIKKSMPFALLVLLMMFYTRLDPVLLGSILEGRLGNEQAGVYAHGFRLLDAATMIAFLFAILLIPIFSKMLKQKESVEQMLKLSFTLIITVAVIVSSVSFFYSQEMMELLYNDDISQSVPVFQLLMMGFVAISTTYIFGTLLTANGNLKELNIIAVISLGINLAINILLIPHLMALGSAIASLTTQFFAAAAQVVLVQRIFRFRVNYSYIFTLLSFVGGVILVVYLSRQFTISIPGIPEDLGWLLNFALALITSLLLAVILRLLHFRSLIGILRQES
ncbi:MAG: oligosaccharide flippase family protein, partial [Bacteroidales bacterium]|nr:oligosaccharide flippase family protein [Bacteroidales bacterium]